jgi:hypothetical protein
MTTQCSGTLVGGGMRLRKLIGNSLGRIEKLLRVLG